MSASKINSGSFLDGVSPITNNLSLFLIQVIVIVGMARLVGVLLKKLNQPSVIAEVVGGIILGPTCLSRIPAFQENVFPKASLPRLKLVADFGLILYLFLVGMELDLQKVARDFKKSAAISLAGIIVPFAGGVGVSKVIYNLYADQTVPFSSFFVFCGVAMSITAFPVLARILASQKLLGTRVGQITLAAAATDDAVAWCLLVLVVALINNPNHSVHALYVFLIVVAFGLFLYFCIRPILVWLVDRSSKEAVASQLNISILFVVLVISALFTEAVGVAAIFGAFLVGLITPHDKGFALQVTEKLEDVTMILLLPLYFAYSGINTQLGELNDATSWGVLFLVFSVACIGKVAGCAISARVTGLPMRESITVGFLMNTKGLVELIVLNIGLQGGVINAKIFAIFVVMALVTTFMTVPLVELIYPMKGYINTIDDENKIGITSMCLTEDGKEKLNIMVCLTSMRCVPAMMNITQLISSGPSSIELIALRLMELGTRISKLMMATDSTETMHADPVINIFRTFGQLNKRNVKSMLGVTEHSGFAAHINENAVLAHANLIIFPVEISKTTYPSGWAASCADKLFEEARCTVAVFGDRGFGVSSAPTIMDIANPVPGANQRIFFPFFGTPDDVEACLFLCTLALEGISIQIILFSKSDASLDILRGKKQVDIQMADTGISPYLVVKAKLASYGNKDLVVIGRESYMSVADGNTLKHAIDHEIASSFLVIHRSIIGNQLSIAAVSSGLDQSSGYFAPKSEML